MIFEKSSFSKVGGSVWEFKIDPKRVREVIKNDIEKDKKKINKKKHQERQKELQKALTPFDLATGGRRGEQFGRPRPLGAPLFARLDNKH